MKEAVRQSLIKDVDRAINILNEDSSKERKDLQSLSEHVIGDVALYRNVDAVTLAILIYSIYKTLPCISEKQQEELVTRLTKLRIHLQKKQFTKYNDSMKRLFEMLRLCNSQIKTHIQDVFYAAKIKKGTNLLEQGLSLARAADLMGVSRWDVLQYGGSSVTQTEHSESWPAAKRLALARKVFSANSLHKVLLVDAGPIITLALSQLLWVLKPLKEKTGMTFYITPAVYSELVEKPQTIKRFQFEALHVQKLIREGVLTMYEKRISKQVTSSLTRLANNSFMIKEGPLEILQAGELETLALSIETKAAMLMDERTLRLLIERPEGMKRLLEDRKRKKVKKNPKKLKEFQQLAGRPGIIRSIEVIAVAFELGLLDPYLPTEGDLSSRRETLLKAILWNAKYHGASVIDHEIDELIRGVLGK
ncbi:hypothetical protein CL619_00880 [archaeon]|nr:hypothetical protein [archaeon]|tara:strand:+ start:1408 stop:2667 length:1260 start_codon:yes stop_codon:yes gene_type:complete